MHAFIAYNVGTMKNLKQYTIRGIHSSLDNRLRKLARKRELSLNAWILEILIRSAGLSEEEKCYSDLDPLFGQWVEDKETLKALAQQRQIDKELWK